LSNPRPPKLDSRPARVARVVLRAARRLLPQACALCRAGSGYALVCDDCAGALPALGPACPRCALPGAGSICGACLRRPPPWTRAHAAWRYDYPVDRLLQGLKYGGQLALAEPLGEGLAETLLLRQAARPDVVVPLPLAPGRQRTRGFDQARLIAAVVARRVGCPLRPALARLRDAGPQAALPLAARAANVKDAFAASAPLAGVRIAIVDDVMTTGATLASAARAACAAGAEVDVWVVARTLPPPR